MIASSAHGDRDAEPGERPEQDDRADPDHGRNEVGPTDMGVSTHRCNVHQAPDGGDDDRAQHGLRQVLEDPREGEQDDDRRAPPT